MLRTSDHHVHAQDSDAMMRLPRVLVINGEPGPSYKLVAQWPFAALETRGYCEVRSARPENLRIFAHIMWCDVVFVVRGFTPNAALAVRLANRMRRFIVVYWDDNIFKVPRQALAEPVIYEFPDNRRSIIEIIKAADMLAVANSRLISSLQDNAASSSIGVTLKVPAVGLVEREPRRQQRLPIAVIGFAGNQVHKGVLQEIVVPALDQLRQEGYQFRLQIIGPRVGVPDSLDCVTEYHDSMAFDEWIRFRENLNWTIALAPLPESDFHACKFQNKFLEYVALGAPGIFSNVPPYSEVIEHRKTGVLVANTPSAWAIAIKELLTNSSLRESIIQESWRTVANEHSMAAVCESYKSELKPAFEFRHPSNLADLRALLDVTRWYIESIFRRILRLIGIRLS